MLRARCSEFERDAPYAVLVDALDAHLAHESVVLPPAHAAQLATVLPALEDLADLAAAPERHRLHRAVRVLLERLAAPRGLVLLLDDVHWADPASSALIASLVRRPITGRVLLVIAYRLHQAGTAVGPELQQAASAGRALRLPVGPLTPGDAEKLLPPGVPASARRRICEEGGGNPFHLHHLARAWDQYGHAGPTGDVIAEVPETAPLSAAARRLLQGAAIAGDPFEAGFAADVAGLAEPAALHALDELVTADLVRAAGRPRWFGFRHPLVRRTVHAGVGAGSRLAAHARAASLLAASGADPATRAHHVALSARPGDRVAIDVLRQASARVVGHAPHTAVGWLEIARSLLDPIDRDAEELELLPQLAEVLGAAGRFDDARRVLLDLLELLDETAEQRLGVIVGCAALDRLLGDHDGARVRLAAELDGLADPGSVVGVSLRLELAAHAALRTDFLQMRDHAATAVVDAAALDDGVLGAAASAVMTMAEYATGDVEAALAQGELAAVRVAALDDRALGQRLEMILHLGWALFFLGDVERAHPLFARGSAVAAAGGSAVLVVELMVGEALSLSARGRVGEALEVADGAIEEARPLGSVQTLVWALYAQTVVLEAGGDAVAAVRAGEEAVTLATGLGPSSIVGACGAALAAALVATGNSRRAATVMLELQGGAELPRCTPGQKAEAYDVLTRAALSSGDVDAARDWVERARRAADASRLPLPVALAQRAQAALLLALGEPERAAQLALTSAATTVTLGFPIATARTRILAGRALAATGDRDAGAAQLRAAEALVSAGHLRNEAVRELRRIGRRVNREGRGGRPDAGGAASLTAREREIATMVACGHTNKAIGATVFLSEKTVESHLASAFVKLGVGSRNAVRAALDGPTGAPDPAADVGPPRP